MNPFKHAYMLLATDFELEPVIDQYLATYPDVQPRKFEIVCQFENERQQGDYCYVVVFERADGRQRPALAEFIKSYCEVHNKVAAVEKSGHVFPDIADANCGNPEKYRSK